MVISEKALLNRMKDAYKGGGYTVVVTNDRHAIITSTWVVDMDSENLPRDVIGLLAVHMGFLPGADTAHKITKTKEGPSVQCMIFETAVKHIRELEQDVLPSMAENRIKKTGLTLDSMNVWQRNIGTGIVLVDPDLEALFYKKEGLAMAGDAFYAEGEISRVWVMKVARDSEDAQMKCLRSIRWTA